MPQTRKKFWEQKIERNKQRDKEVNKYYRKSNLNIFRIWEHDMRKNSNKISDDVILFLQGNRCKVKLKKER